MYCWIDVGYLASFQQMHADPQADLVRGRNPGYAFPVVNRC
jgi:hypothetical protein